MRRFRTTVVLALAILLSVSISAQQAATTAVPNFIRYSGTLKDAQGAALSSATAVGVTFSIYKQQDGGAAVWMETQNVTPDGNGQYSVVLGSTTAAGLPDDLFSQQEQRWLGVQVQGEAEQARVLLVSVPYAFKAHEAETLGGLPASAFVQTAPSNASGSGSTNTGTAVNALNKAGNANVSSKGKSAAASRNNTICPALTANASANYIPLFDPTVCNLVNSTIYQSAAGYVGINQTNPSTQLDVNGAINASPTSADNTGNYQILENPVLSIGWPSRLTVLANHNLYVGLEAGAQGFLQATATGNTGIGNTFVGYRAAFHNQSGSTNTAVGAGAGFRNTTGNNNTSVGVDAAFGVFGEAVSNNIIMGYAAGLSNTGSNVSFYGYQAGYNNSANNNSFFGFSAGTANTTGNANTFLGNLAGTANTTGRGNTFLGDQAGTNNILGSFNTFTGQNAGVANTTGSANTFTGDGAGIRNTAGSNNSYYGYNAGGAGQGPTALGNSFFGTFAGLVNTTGSRNTCMGEGSCYSDATGNNNTAIGENAGANYTGDNSIFVGYGAGYNTGTHSHDDIYIGSPGCSFLGCSETNVIRIGAPGQHGATFIAGVVPNVVPNPANVYISPSGQLEVGSSGVGVMGSCATTGSLARWLTSASIGCSVIQQTSIGGITVNADVTVSGGIAAFGDISTQNNLGAGGIIVAQGGLIHGGVTIDDGDLLIDDGDVFIGGNLDVSGTITAGVKDFKIDDPIDPANKFLYHSAIESSEMMNLYTGNVVTDGQGDAVVQLPDWFGALNRDFRYQLTPIGQFAQAIVAKELEDNRFSIKTDKPNVKVSWQITGVRQDAYAKAHPFHTEVDKPEPGYYLHPELFGAPPEQGINWAQHSKMMKATSAHAMGVAKRVSPQ